MSRYSDDPFLAMFRAPDLMDDVRGDLDETRSRRGLPPLSNRGFNTKYNAAQEVIQSIRRVRHFGGVGGGGSGGGGDMLSSKRGIKKEKKKGHHKAPQKKSKRVERVYDSDETESESDSCSGSDC